MPLTITILGAGIAGLTAAIALRRQGHAVTVLEKSSFSQPETGAAQATAPNATCCLQRLGVDIESGAGGNLVTGLTAFKGSGELKAANSMAELAKQWKSPWIFVHRGDFHALLRKTAVEAGAELVLGCRIKEIDAETGQVEAEGGKMWQSDVIVGADGINSQARKEVVGEEMQLKPFGKRCYRWLVDKETMWNDPVTKELVKEDGVFVETSSADRRIIMYPCRANTTINCVAFLPEEVQESEQDWNQKANRNKLGEGFAHFFAAPRRMLDFAGDDLRSWQVFDLEELPCWTKGRMVLIGDAAHAILPFLGQGGAMAIEDATALGLVLGSGTSSKDVPKKLKFFEDIRKERVDYIQTETRIFGRDEDKGRPPPGSMIQLYIQYHKFDAWEDTEAKLKEASAQHRTTNGHI